MIEEAKDMASSRGVVQDHYRLERHPGRGGNLRLRTWGTGLGDVDLIQSPIFRRREQPWRDHIQSPLLPSLGWPPRCDG